MHGLWFVLLQGFVDQHYPEGTWKKILQMAGFSSTTLYFNNKDYPDGDFFKMVNEICREDGKTLDEFLLLLGEYFGEFFFKNYDRFLDPSWKSLEMIEKWPYYFYKILQAPAPQYQTGSVRSERKDADHVVIYYQSPRHLCSMMEGASRAVFKFFKEKGRMDHPHCMKRGDPYCELVFEKQREAANKPLD